MPHSQRQQRHWQASENLPRIQAMAGIQYPHTAWSEPHYQEHNQSRQPLFKSQLAPPPFRNTPTSKESEEREYISQIKKSSIWKSLTYAKPDRQAGLPQINTELATNPTQRYSLYTEAPNQSEPEYASLRMTAVPEPMMGAWWLNNKEQITECFQHLYYYELRMVSLLRNTFRLSITVSKPHKLAPFSIPKKPVTKAITYYPTHNPVLTVFEKGSDATIGEITLTDQHIADIANILANKLISIKHLLEAFKAETGSAIPIQTGPFFISLLLCHLDVLADVSVIYTSQAFKNRIKDKHVLKWLDRIDSKLAALPLQQVLSSQPAVRAMFFNARGIFIETLEEHYKTFTFSDMHNSRLKPEAGFKR